MCSMWRGHLSTNWLQGHDLLALSRRNYHWRANWVLGMWYVSKKLSSNSQLYEILKMLFSLKHFCDRWLMLWSNFSILVCAAGYTLEDTECRACPADTFKSQVGNNITCTRCVAHSTTSERKAQTSNTCGMCGQKFYLEKIQLMLCFIIVKITYSV